MKTPYGHLTYCSNIHTGESWDMHFGELKANIPQIKNATSHNSPFGIGLRLSNQASIDLSVPEKLTEFKNWLAENDCYVFTMNGFPYGGFHNVEVKDQVQTPDWTTSDRVNYTIRMFKILVKLLPDSLLEGGISTSPLSYRFWWENGQTKNAIETATQNILLVVDELIEIGRLTEKKLHLDIEPEPSGSIENGTEFIGWFQEVLMPMAIIHFANKGISKEKAIKYIRRHVQLCYDVCHFGVSFEQPQNIINQLNIFGIRVGKMQISSALKVDLKTDAEAKIAALAQYNEPTYLHQVVAKCIDGHTEKFADLPKALANYVPNKYSEWRVHFHVPLFLENFGLLSSTQSEIVKTLSLHKKNAFTNHLEIETYTWGVLPKETKVPLNDSIIREIEWVKDLLNN